MKKLSLETAEDLAAKFRGDLGFGETECISVKSILRKKNILTMYKPLSNGFYGLSLKSKSGYFFILINSNDTKGRQHFTVAHELFHLFYDDNPTPHMCRAESGSNTSERNADIFASALLMPKKGLLQSISPQEIKDKKVKLATIIKLEQYYSASRSSLLYRLKALGLLNDADIEKFKTGVIESAKQYGYNTDLYKKGNENLVISDFGEKAKLLYDSEKISESYYNELLNLITNEEN